MSNYPAGSMRGSGIYSFQVDYTLTCDKCGTEAEVLADVNDYGNLSAECEKCGHRNDLGDYTELD